MKQIQFALFGQPSQVARCVDVDDVGPPSAWEVIIDVEAFPINVADLAVMSGRYGTLPKLPSNIGMEAVGIVAEKGTSVTELSVGDRVVLLANNNWAERRRVPAAAVHKVPAQVDVLQLAMLKVNPATAHSLLHHFVNLNANDWILQNAPLSSVGTCVIQLAKQMGIRTINVVRKAESIPVVTGYGGDIAIEEGPDLASRIRALTKGAQLKIAFDAVAGPSVQRLAESLSEGGIVVNYGMLSGSECQISPEQTIFRGITLRGFWLSKLLNRLSLDERRTLFDALAMRMVEGQLKMPVDSYYPIELITHALQRAEQPSRNGKVMVVVGKQ